MHGKINERCDECTYNLEDDPLYPYQRFTEVQNKPVFTNRLQIYKSK